MFISLIIFGLFFINGSYYGQNPKTYKGLLYSITIALFLLVLFSFLGAGSQFSGMLGAMSGLGFYSGFKKGKKDLSKLELQNSEVKFQKINCKHCKKENEISEEQLGKGSFICLFCNKENLM